MRLRLPDFSLYALCLVLLLTAGWLLPNHYKPWNTFHSNAWTAGTLLLVAWRQLLLERTPLAVTPSGLLLLVLCVLPWLHHATGLLALRDDALLNCLYLLGVALAYLTGLRWARRDTDGVIDLLLGAAAIAAGVQVSIQIYQWLGYAESLDLLDIWILPFAGARPYGNLGQPNQLGSLILWGMLGCAWAACRGHIRVSLAMAIAALLCVGAAMTASRTALVSLTVALLTVSVLPARTVPTPVKRRIQLLYAVYLAVFFWLAALGDSLKFLEREATITRPALARMAVDAANQRPWLGWGWNKTNEAYLDVYPRHPTLAGAYVEQSHNLVLDLAIWVGWPLCMLLTGAALWWLWRSLRAVRTPAHALALGGLGVMLVHAMLEFPLHYGYFLWPFAMLAGVCGAAWETDLRVRLPRAAAAAVLAVVSTLCVVLSIDYLRVEETFRELRFQLQRVGTGHDERPPEVMLMHDWRDFMVMMRETPHAGMTDAKIDHWRALLLYNTAPLPMRKLIGALELNGRHDEAVYWSDRACALLAPPKCNRMLDEWTRSGASQTLEPDESALEKPRPASALTQ